MLERREDLVSRRKDCVLLFLFEKECSKSLHERLLECSIEYIKPRFFNLWLSDTHSSILYVKELFPTEKVSPLLRM